MKILILIGGNGGVGKHLLVKSLKYFDKVVAIDKIIPTKKLHEKVDYHKINLLDDNLGPKLIEKLKVFKGESCTIIFAQRPFVDLNPKSNKDDIIQALKISLLSSLDIIENCRENFKLKSVAFIGSINSELVCDQPLSYMIAKSSCDTAIKFMSKKYPEIIFLNFILGLVNIKDKTNNFSSNLHKENAAYAAIGFRNIPELDLISENIFNFIFHSNPLTSGNNIYLDYGQHFTDSFWSARIAADNKYD